MPHIEEQWTLFQVTTTMFPASPHSDIDSFEMDTRLIYTMTPGGKFS